MGSRLAEDERYLSGPHSKSRIRHRYGFADRLGGSPAFAGRTCGGLGIP
jgi:hypothetical protein